MTLSDLRTAVDRGLANQMPGPSILLQELTYKKENMDGRFTPADELIKLRDAGLISQAEARAVVLDMFPQIQRLATARTLVAEADAA